MGIRTLAFVFVIYIHAIIDKKFQCYSLDIKHPHTALVLGTLSPDYGSIKGDL